MSTQIKFTDLLRAMQSRNASDLFITPNLAPSLKVDGKIYPLASEKMGEQQVKKWCYELMNAEQRQKFEETKECNFALHTRKLGRYRVNVFQQQCKVGMVLRTIKTNIPSIGELRLPPVLEDIILRKRGLVLIVGGTGQGKSTTMASLVDYRNRTQNDHIITIEDPIEYLHVHKKSIITQREVGVDTLSFNAALVNAMRQAPDVIQIGEIRTLETMENAILFSETGHLCIATLHANNSYQALDRIFNFFGTGGRDQIAMDLSINLYAIVALRLLPIEGQEGRVPAVEVMINSPLMSDVIRESRIDEIRELMKNSSDWGMQTFDQSLFDLYERGLVSYADVIRNAESENDLRLTIKMESKREGAERNWQETLADVDVS